MPINIITNRLKIKNDQGQYVSIDAVTDKTTNERLTEINTAGATQLSQLNARGEQLKNIIIAPTRVTDDDGLGIIVEAGTSEMTEDVIEARVDEYLEQVVPPNYIVDSNLDTSGAAADAKITGEKIRDLEVITNALAINISDKSDDIQIEVDDTLTTEGMAADAKATGDRISALENIGIEEKLTDLEVIVDALSIEHDEDSSIGDLIVVQDTQPDNNSDAQIWFPETLPAGIELPTVSEMNTALSGKTDRVYNAVGGHFAALDQSGNLFDSGYDASSFGGNAQDISGKADKVTGAVANNFAALDSNGNLIDSGYNHSSFSGGGGSSDVSGKADKVSGATNNNFAALDSNGNLKDSGHKHGDYQSSIGTVNGILKANGSGVISAAVSGTDYYVKPSGGIPSTDLASNVIPTVHNVPSGGTTGQVLSKTSATNYDVQWSTPYTGTVTETISSSTPIINGADNHRYVCGTCSTLTINVPSTGIIDILFESGTTATDLTINPPTGGTIHWTNNFDPTNLSTNTTYEINILNCYGLVVAWS